MRIANHFFPYFYCYDAARGWGLRPNTAGYYRREGASYVEVNGDGFRGPDFARPKPPGTVPHRGEVRAAGPVGPEFA